MLTEAAVRGLRAPAVAARVIEGSRESGLSPEKRRVDLPRLFTGIEVPPHVGLALSLKRGGLQGARWIDPENYHITLRFQSNGSGPDEYHEDAYSCFQEMRNLIPQAGMWRADFNDTQTAVQPRRHGGPVPVDCLAPIMVVQE